MFYAVLPNQNQNYWAGNSRSKGHSSFSFSSFRGEKLDRRRVRTSRAEVDEDRLFSAVYDRHFGRDGHGRAGRSDLPSVLKYRKKFVKDSGN